MRLQFDDNSPFNRKVVTQSNTVNLPNLSLFLAWKYINSEKSFILFRLSFTIINYRVIKSFPLPKRGYSCFQFYSIKIISTQIQNINTPFKYHLLKEYDYIKKNKTTNTKSSSIPSN